MKKQKWYNFTIILLSLILSCLYLWKLGNYNQIAVLSDEYGYWGIAALLSGYDWSGLITSMSYYSFGYSLLLLPLVKYISNMEITYQLAIILNALMGIVSFHLLNHILQKLGKKQQNIWILLASFATMCYPCIQVYTKVAWPETLIIMLYLSLAYLVIKQVENLSLWNTLLTGFLLSYIFWTHQRTLIIIVAILIVYCYLLLKDRRYIKHTFLLSAMIMIGICANQYIKHFLMKRLWQHSANVYDNDFSGQIEKLKQFLNMENSILLTFGILFAITGILLIYKLFSTIPEKWRSLIGYGIGILLMLISILSVCIGKNLYANSDSLFAISEMSNISRLITSIMGKLYYMLSSTYFMAAWGIACLIHILLKNAVMEQKVTGFFFALSFGGSFLLNVFSNYQCYRADSVLYGRYSEYAMFPLIALGILYFIHVQTRAGITLFLISLFCQSGLIIAVGISKLGIQSSNNLINTTALPSLYTSTDFQNIYDTGCTVLLVYSILFVLLYYVHSERKRILIVATCLGILWSVSARQTEDSYLLRKQILQKQYEEPVIEYLKTHEKKEIYYVLTGDVKDMWAYGMQFCLKDTTWKFIKFEALTEQSGDAYIVTLASADETIYLEPYYTKILETDFYCMYVLP